MCVPFFVLAPFNILELYFCKVTLSCGKVLSVNKISSLSNLYTIWNIVVMDEKAYICLFLKTSEKQTKLTLKTDIGLQLPILCTLNLIYMQ